MDILSEAAKTDVLWICMGAVFLLVWLSITIQSGQKPPPRQ